MKTPPLLQLQTFLIVARRRSFSAAARELGVSPSSVSQSIRQLESRLGLALLTRTTRSVALTEGGQRLLDSTGPSLDQTMAALNAVSARPGEVVGKVRLSVPRLAVPLVITPVLPTFRARHPKVEVEIVVEDRLVDIVAEGFDAGVRLSEAIERDMVQLRLTGEARFVVVAAPSYLDEHGTPAKPEELLEHECVTFRSPTTGSLYAWELERGRRTWRVAVRGGVVSNDGESCVALAEAGLGLAYAFEPSIKEQLKSGRLKTVLEPYAASVPGYFLYYPSRAQRSPALQLFVETAKQILRADAAAP